MGELVQFGGDHEVVPKCYQSNLEITFVMSLRTTHPIKKHVT